jgi:hypothetical protein
MKVAYVRYYNEEASLFLSEEFKNLDVVVRLDILRDLKYWVDAHYSDARKEWYDGREKKSEVIKQRARQRAFQAYDLRKKAMTYKAIGEEMDISSTRAQHLVRKAERIIEREKRLNNETSPSSCPSSQQLSGDAPR